MSLVSIILPTYNREKFLPIAFQNISEQTYKNFELIVVDDGSTDDTSKVLQKLIAKYRLKVKVIEKPNGGPADARKVGITAATGEFFAFYDSDDTWESIHIEKAIEVLFEHEDIDWIYFDRRDVYFESNIVATESNFYRNNVPQDIFKCIREIRGTVNVLDNKRSAVTQLKTGIDCALQNSVIRRQLFDVLSIPNFRIGEDRLFVLMALKANFTLAFCEDKTATYFIHNDNISDPNPDSKDYKKRIDSLKLLLKSYKLTPDYVKLDRHEVASLKGRLANEYFWVLGYGLQLKSGDHKAALNSMLKAIRLKPLNLIYYRTFITTILKTLLK